MGHVLTNKNSLLYNDRPSWHEQYNRLTRTKLDGSCKNVEICKHLPARPESLWVNDMKDSSSEISRRTNTIKRPLEDSSIEHLLKRADDQYNCDIQGHSLLWRYCVHVLKKMQDRACTVDAFSQHNFFHFWVSVAKWSKALLEYHLPLGMPSKNRRKWWTKPDGSCKNDKISQHLPVHSQLPDAWGEAKRASA